MLLLLNDVWIVGICAEEVRTVHDTVHRYIDSTSGVYYISVDRQDRNTAELGWGARVIFPTSRGQPGSGKLYVSGIHSQSSQVQPTNSRKWTGNIPQVSSPPQ